MARQTARRSKGAAKPRRGGGRPSTYRPEYCELVVELGSEGKSRTQIAAKLGTTRETLSQWSKTHPEFSVALKVSKEYEQAWWEEMGQMGLSMGKSFNATAFIFQMKNRFRADYTDVHRLEHSGDEAFLAIMKAISGGVAQPA